MRRLILPFLILSVLSACQRPPQVPVSTASPSAPGTPVSSPTAAAVSTDRIKFPKLAEAGIEVQAVWQVPEGDGMRQLLESPTVGDEIQNLAPVERKRSYEARELQGFLPEEAALGVPWKVPAEQTRAVLNQFSDQVITEMNMDASGSYGILVGQSPDYLEVQLRLHAQFEVITGVFFSPAEFSGHMVVNRKNGSVEFFEVGVPTERALNLGYEMHVGEFLVGLGFIPEMRISGGDRTKLETDWTEQITHDLAAAKLAQSFYAFEKINWVPPNEATALAQKTKRPIFAVVIEGVLTDQSC